MKTILAAAALIAGLGISSVIAADGPVMVDVPAIEAATNWNGIYAGVGVTGAYSPNFAETLGFIDVIVGGNVQAGQLVFGAEAYLSGWTSNLAGPGTSVGGEVRVGFLAKPEVLVYLSGGGMRFITGGATYGQAGVGLEFAAAEKMTIDIEYKFWQEMGGPNQIHSLSSSVLWHF